MSNKHSATRSISEMSSYNEVHPIGGNLKHRKFSKLLFDIQSFSERGWKQPYHIDIYSLNDWAKAISQP